MGADWERVNKIDEVKGNVILHGGIVLVKQSGSANNIK